MSVTAIIFVLPVAMTLLAVGFGVDHPLFFCLWLLSAIVCLGRGCFIVRRKQLLGWFCIRAAIVQVFLLLPPVLHIWMHNDGIRHDMGGDV
jgi:hypothetical protein